MWTLSVFYSESGLDMPEVEQDDTTFALLIQFKGPDLVQSLGMENKIIWLDLGNVVLELNLYQTQSPYCV